MSITKIISIVFFPVLFSIFVFQADILTAQTGKNRHPNILFCIADDASYTHFGANGCSWIKTPGFDRVAKEGIRFTHAYTPNAKCAPSRSCILTGRNPWQLEAAANHNPFFPQKFQTYCEALTEQGYYVASSGKGWGPGVALDEQGRKRDMTGIKYDKYTYTPSTSKMCNIDFGRNFTTFLKSKPHDKPWFFWLGSTDPHRGYEYGSGVKSGKNLSDIDRVPGCFPDDPQVRNDLLDYAIEIENFDQNVINVIELLEQSGELDNTLIVVTSDNGMPFPCGKGNTYEMATHMPLAVMWKNGIVQPGRTVDDFISFIDFAPTFLDIAQVEQEKTKMLPITGESLRPIFESERNGLIIPYRDKIFLGRERTDLGRPHDAGYPIRAVIRDHFMYLYNFEPDRWPGGNPETGYLDSDDSPTKTLIVNSRNDKNLHQYWQRSFGFRPQEELYDLSVDPDCMVNLASEQSVKSEKLREELFAELKRQEDPRMSGLGHIFDEYPHCDEFRRGLYERWQSTPNAGPDFQKKLKQQEDEKKKSIRSQDSNF
ncbi:MAG: sulfatase [Planctomycetaceae bacterium]|jgi:arylsulfatase A-like enzyme|nr:sulfatase [Planctomycetaceae bacterium]